MGARNHHLISRYLDQLKGAIVEIGAGRGEGSTDFFAGIAAARPEFQYHSVDFDPEAHKIINRYKNHIANMHAHQLRGEDFLADHILPTGEKICWAYLDNFDWNYYEGEPPMYVQRQIARYQEFGLVMNNANSQQAHLDQAKLVAAAAAERCVIHFDDTRTWDGVAFDGKGGTAVPWLLSQGWHLLHQSTSNIACCNFV
jgi:hypothetical protein